MMVNKTKIYNLSAYVSLYGKVYDITKWIDKHPGGSDLLEWVAGSDCTNLFESYHKLQTKNILGTEKVPCVGELETHKFPPYSVDTGFYTSKLYMYSKHFRIETKR
jgi:cytochrome b involved in lipid metabolism